ncbi:hypothetical protein BABINDRAFT_160324 [Babjeviella inositovora NRRL Y-12698]|uniref:Uncharacterized protein n=1 Tax=Babjeviella inositovora NRRL Y-12698 TaxID=984486 RepID=A0A1E3QWS9_9ASCO|nr:uncharacterized protein BABINDRAFT_160324 [Babjeviella inositovora NRRL Y-12698]ODQ82149.1 hypothetical protein BABINDRAFT_160324 [Babjeviella inositovora NRRL Y-12698]
MLKAQTARTTLQSLVSRQFSSISKYVTRVPQLLGNPRRCYLSGNASVEKQKQPFPLHSLVLPTTDALSRSILSFVDQGVLTDTDTSVEYTHAALKAGAGSSSPSKLLLFNGPSHKAVVQLRSRVIDELRNYRKNKLIFTFSETEAPLLQKKVDALRLQAPYKHVFVEWHQDAGKGPGQVSVYAPSRDVADLLGVKIRMALEAARVAVKDKSCLLENFEV